MASDMLAYLGFPVVSACSAADALMVLTEEPQIALLFSDVRMPGTSRIELAERAQRIRPDIKVVLTSGYAADELLPAMTFVRKPFLIADLKEAISRALDDLR